MPRGATSQNGWTLSEAIAESREGFTENRLLDLLDHYKSEIVPSVSGLCGVAEIILKRGRTTGNLPCMLPVVAVMDPGSTIFPYAWCRTPSRTAAWLGLRPLCTSLSAVPFVS